MDFLMNLIQLGLDAGILALCCEVVFRQKAEIKAKEFFIFPIFLSCFAFCFLWKVYLTMIFFPFLI